ncbi:MAG: hypothetical protein JO257_08945 [Deltaproteobacteria bacterium]|nr:hypothetical protein [Deltaproteobacteria bacterium]
MRPLLLIALAACTSTANGGKFNVDGNISGSAPPTGKVVFVWDTRSQQYKWGEGTSTAGNFTVTLDPSPPKDAFIAMTGDAVGIPVLIDNSQTIADGPVTLGSVARLGIATDYAVIYKTSTVEDVPDLPWVKTFGASYSCAMCVRGGNGGKDSWQLTPCANVQIVVGGADASVCNWK